MRYGQAAPGSRGRRADIVVAIASLLAACGGKDVPGGDRDAGQATDTAADAAADAATPDARPEPSCGITPIDLQKLCAGAASCPVRVAVSFACGGIGIDVDDLAVSAAGHAFFVPTANARQAYLVHVPPAGAPTLTTIDDAHWAFVAAGPDADDDPRVLTVRAPNR
jgi:hypothetical protein